MQMNDKKLIIITGAGGGMGRAICDRLKSYYHIIAIDRNADKLARYAESDNITPLCSELTAPDFFAKLQELIQSLNHIPLYGLINLAAVSQGAPVTRITDEDWDYSIETNVSVPMKLIRLITPQLINHQAGSIINVGSPVGIVGANKVSYAASKAALHGLTMSVARELGIHGIRVNLLLPGPTITDMTQDWPAEKREAIAQGSFLKRLCQADEIAASIEFLLSEQSSYMTGSVFDMTAGSMWGH